MSAMFEHGCDKCENDPCECGYDYKDWSDRKILEHIAMLERVLRAKEDGTIEKMFVTNELPIPAPPVLDKPVIDKQTVLILKDFLLRTEK